MSEIIKRVILHQKDSNNNDIIMRPQTETSQIVDFDIEVNYVSTNHLLIYNVMITKTRILYIINIFDHINYMVDLYNSIFVNLILYLKCIQILIPINLLLYMI